MTASATIEGTVCLICRGDNPSEAILCGHCLAPLALTQDSSAQGRKPCIISVVGESNVGKTVYLGYLLDMLSRRAGDYEAVPRGPYAVTLQQNVMSHIAARCFPPKTPNEVDQWHWVYCQVRRRDSERWYDLVMPDMAGESLAIEIESPNSYTAVRGLLEQTSAAMVLVDASLAAAGHLQPDFFAFKLLSYMDQLTRRRDGRKIPTPIAVVLCKSDYCPQAFDDPETFARTNLNRTWNLCDSRFANVAFFASSVIGALGFATDKDGQVVPIPLHSAPRGVLEPFEWLLTAL